MNPGQSYHGEGARRGACCQNALLTVSKIPNQNPVSLTGMSEMGFNPAAGESSGPSFHTMSYAPAGYMFQSPSEVHTEKRTGYIQSASSVRPPPCGGCKSRLPWRLPGRHPFQAVKERRRRGAEQSFGGYRHAIAMPYKERREVEVVWVVARAAGARLLGGGFAWFCQAIWSRLICSRSSFSSL